MGFTTDPSMVRVDLFKPSGKWYTTLEVKWDRYFSTIEKPGGIQEYESIEVTFKRLMKGHNKDFTAVCLKPYHENAHPLLIKIGEI